MRTVGRLLLVSSLALLALAAAVMAQSGGAALDRPAPEIAGGPWMNGPALTPEALRGRVVFVEFWTYG